MKTVVSTILGLVVIAMLLFLPAGTVAYWQGRGYFDLFGGSAQRLPVADGPGGVRAPPTGRTGNQAGPVRRLLLAAQVYRGSQREGGVDARRGAGRLRPWRNAFALHPELHGNRRVTGARPRDAP